MEMVEGNQIIKGNRTRCLNGSQVIKTIHEIKNR